MLAALPSEEPAPDGAARARRRDDKRVWTAAALVSIYPVLRMAWWVREGTVTQYADYWEFAQETFQPNGWPALHSLVEFQGQHLLSVPQLVYWANMRLFGGSNITLGYFVVAVAAAQVVVLVGWVVRLEDAPTPLRIALVAAVVAMVFAPHGAWNFLLSMSGTAWLTANLLALVSITLAVRGRPVPAAGLALVATVTYGTGLLVWPAIVVVALVRRRWRTALAVAAVSAVVLATYYLRRAADPPTSPPEPGPVEVFTNCAALVGGLFVRDLVAAQILGGVVLVATLVLALWAASSRRDGDTAWIALGVYAMGSAAIIGFSRDIGESTNTSRYSSVAALIWLSLLGLAATALGPWLRARGPALTATGIVALLALVAAFGDVATVHTVQEKRASQQQLADALRVGVAAGGPWLILKPFPDLTQLFSAIGHHPFDSRYEGGCDLLGTTIDPASLVPTGGEVDAGPLTVETKPNMTEAIILRGGVDRPGWHLDCAAVVDEEGGVVGVGRGGYARPLGTPSTTIGLWAIAPTGSDTYQLVVRFRESDRLYALPTFTAPSG